MSSKNNVNPDHYKVAGRDRPNETVQQVHRQQRAEAESRLRRDAHRQPKASRDAESVAGEEVQMSGQTSRKAGVTSTAQKTGQQRHPFDTTPASQPVPGAFGREGEAAPDSQRQPAAERSRDEVLEDEVDG
jgi:hypothetical protein